MSKAEILRQLAASANASKLAGLSQQIETLRQARLESAEHLAAILEPLAQAMAALTDETRQTLYTVEATAQQQREQAKLEIESVTKTCQEAASTAHRAAERLDNVGRHMELNHYLMSLSIGLLAAMLVSAFWLWLAPRPQVMNQLDAKQVAEYLAPAIAAAKRSSGN